MTDARDVVQAQYETWIYPLPIQDLAQYRNDGGFDLGDPALVRRKLWPRNVEPEALEILVAGCGTHQAAVYAFANPGCRVVGVDISETSLDHERLLKANHQLDNLELRQLPVENVDDLNQSFDLIVSTGVLHHLPDPDRGLRSLRDALSPRGVMTLMLYGHYGRLGVYMLQDTLRLLGAEQDHDGLELARELLEEMPDWHPAHHYLEMAPDLGYDAGLVDTFLHRVDRAYTVPQVLQFAVDNGLTFQSWLDNLPYSVSAKLSTDDPLGRRVDSLDKPKQWALVELLWQLLPTHYFLLCHPDRPASDYTVDFVGGGWLDCVPSLRPPLQVVMSQTFRSPSIDDAPASGAIAIERLGHRVELDALGAAILDLVNGATPIRQILQETSPVATQAGWDPDEHLGATRLFFQRMADWDHLLFEIP